VSTGTVVRDFDATNMAPTQKDKSLLSSNGRPQFQEHKRSWNEHKLGQVVPTGPETKNDCAGEGQQQFTGLENGRPWTALVCRAI
jgi:hypothetical protein